MSKRSIIAIMIIAAIAAGLAFYARKRSSHGPVQRPVETVSAVRMKAVPPRGPPHIQKAKQSKYSQQEYTRLRQRYPPHPLAANGPLPRNALDMLASNTKTSLNDQSMWPLVRNVLYGKTVALENAIDTGLNPDTEVYLYYPYNSNVSLLDLAIISGQRGVINLLLSHDAAVTPTPIEAPNGENFQEMAPLPTAAMLGEDDVVRALLDSGANIEEENDYDSNRQTALAAAVFGVNVSTAYLLLSQGADVNSALGPGGVVPDFLVRYYPLPQMVAMRNLLVEHGASLPMGQGSGS
jgi:Ankyrin repeats (3 copies)